MGISFIYGKSVITLPGSVQKHLDRATKKDLKVLFALSSCLEAVNEAEDIIAHVAKVCGMDRDTVSASVAFWRGAGVIELTEADDAPTDAVPAQVDTAPITSELPNPVPTKKILPADELPSYTTAELNEILADRREAAQLIDECQALMGKMFNPHEVSIVIGMVDYLKLDSEYIIILFDYCSRIGKKSLHYIRKLAFSLYDEGITDSAELSAKIKKIEADALAETEIRKLFGMTSRALTAKEKKFISNWLGPLGFGIDMIKKAYEITVDATHEPSPAYANAILERWHRDGIRTPEDIERENSEKLPNGGSFDTDKFFEAALKRSFSSEPKGGA